jgi:hypothetical protein
MYLSMEEYLVYNNSIFEFLPRVIIFAIAGISSYLVVTYFMNKEIKSLVKAVIKELTKK